MVTRSPKVTAAARRAALSVAAAVGELVAQRLQPRRQLLGAVVGALELVQPGGRLLGPGQHLVDGVAVLALHPRQLGPSLLHPGQPRRVDLDTGQVGREVTAEVGGEVAQLGQPAVEVEQGTGRARSSR